MAKTGAITEHERIRRLRGHSVTGLARKTGFSHAYVSMVESRQVRPSARYRAAATKALGVPESLIFPQVALAILGVLLLRLLPLEECAERTGTTIRFWRRLIFEKRIPYMKVGKFVRVDENDFRAFVEAGRVEPPR
jgi:excisionase family DNA binding protein